MMILCDTYRVNRPVSAVVVPLNRGVGCLVSCGLTADIADIVRDWSLETDGVVVTHLGSSLCSRSPPLDYLSTAGDEIPGQSTRVNGMSTAFVVSERLVRSSGREKREIGLQDSGYSIRTDLDHRGSAGAFPASPLPCTEISVQCRCSSTGCGDEGAMSRQNPASRRPVAFTACRQPGSRPAWDCEQFDAELRIVLASVDVIKDPAKRAWQAGRMIELHTRLSDIRTAAVHELRVRGASWSDIARQLGVSRGRAWKLGQPRNRKT